ncbi:MAG: hypothetical protein OSJ27_08665 [Candidatus Gastranaerophilales bacterium]|nr:hypothetical protein [Candidatus Gastranaerophilales bacterium]
MEIICCGVKYSTRDINTFDKFEKFLISQNNLKQAMKLWMNAANTLRDEACKKLLSFEYFIKRKNQSFDFIEIYKLNCNKKRDLNNPCRKAKILYFKMQGRQRHLVDEQSLSGEDVEIFLSATKGLREEKPIFCPVKNIPNCRQIPWTTPEATGPTTAGVKYLGVNIWQKKRAYKSPVRILSN